MLNGLSTPDFQVLQSLHLAQIDAVGFDLDHTLALYDDAGVNARAIDATRTRLVDLLGYPLWVAELLPHRSLPAAARALAAELGQGVLVKLDAERRVCQARTDGRWLDAAQLRARFARPILDSREDAYPVYSPFELPVLWLFEALIDDPRFPSRPDPRALCRDVSRTLDLVHTDGTLKAVLLDGLAAFVSPVPGAGEALLRWREAGKRLFVATNSEPEYAERVLDRVVGPAWKHTFDLVAVSSRKPAFFTDDTPVRSSGSQRRGTGRILEGATAGEVEAILGVQRNRVLYVGDNPNADTRAARRFGWRTVHVAAELVTAPGDEPDEWGHPLEHNARPTWLARQLQEHADAVCTRVDALLSLAPDSRLEPPRDAVLRGAGRERP